MGGEQGKGREGNEKGGKERKGEKDAWVEIDRGGKKK